MLSLAGFIAGPPVAPRIASLACFASTAGSEGGLYVPCSCIALNAWTRAMYSFSLRCTPASNCSGVMTGTAFLAIYRPWSLPVGVYCHVIAPVPLS